MGASLFETLVDPAKLERIDYVALALALVLGGAIGLEREVHGRPAGLRTHILVCLSSTMLILVSRAVAAEGADLGLGEVGRLVFDPNRMGAGIVTGIGFLGAACVLRSGDVLRGLTTAACIWFVAGLGIVLGTGYYFLGIVGTLVTLFVLTLLNRMASGIDPIIYRRLIVLASGGDLPGLANRIQEGLEELDLRVLDVASGHDNLEGRDELVFYVSLRNRLQSPVVTERVAAEPGVLSARWKQVHSE